MTIREAKIILPMTDNDGHSLASLLQDVRVRMVDQFGGITIREAQGAWMGPSGMVCEDVWELMCAYDDNAHNDFALARIARMLCAEARQECIYVRFASGTVQLIDRDTAIPLAA